MFLFFILVGAPFVAVEAVVHVCGLPFSEVGGEVADCAVGARDGTFVGEGVEGDVEGEEGVDGVETVGC